MHRNITEASQLSTQMVTGRSKQLQVTFYLQLSETLVLDTTCITYATTLKSLYVSFLGFSLQNSVVYEKELCFNYNY